ncbi:hypothetical protein QBC46DRAFT_463001 [Diplogelasinospora grovesii]|uniref:LysM domain-containing protein n=1 Tax=Diplogelasinospora grovesii TaxID=303347 RepID=A0AAN6MU76_9PEZI|nr:hypothetical protein QBC46DRAFT_463001 [Diplogelasinospora grovesii]
MLFAAALFLVAASRVSATVSLYNGLQATVLTPNITTSCNDTFNIALECESLIQLTPYRIAHVNWDASSLSALCTTACKSSLAELTTASESTCGNDVFYIDGNNMTLHHLVDLIQYKWGLLYFCLNVEDTWSITTMEAENAATWPNNTQKCYLGSSEGYWQHYTDGNGTCIEPEWGHEKSSVFETSGYTGMAAMDYYYTVPAPIDDDNYGWAEILDFDEYPLEIQCSSCFLQKFKYGYEGSWGNTWDELTEQVWANIKLNCQLTDVLTPAYNVSGVINEGDWLADPSPVTTVCPQNISVAASESYTCQQAAVQFGIAMSGLFNLNNNLNCRNITGTSICAPMSCPVTVVDLGPTEFANETMGVSP